MNEFYDYVIKKAMDELNGLTPEQREAKLKEAGFHRECKECGLKFEISPMALLLNKDDELLDSCKERCIECGAKW